MSYMFIRLDLRCGGRFHLVATAENHSIVIEILVRIIVIFKLFHTSIELCSIESRLHVNYLEYAHTAVRCLGFA